jgi:hypothetical protein
LSVITHALKTAKASLTHDEAEDLLSLVLSGEDSGKENLQLLDGLPCIPLVGGNVGVLKAQGGAPYFITSQRFCALLSGYPRMVNPHSKSFKKLYYWATNKAFFNISLMTPQVVADSMHYVLPPGWQGVPAVKPPFNINPVKEQEAQTKEIDAKWLSVSKNKKRGKGRNPTTAGTPQNSNQNENSDTLTGYDKIRFSH